MNKFLLILILIICFLGSLFLFGRNKGESRCDYCLLWLKSSLLTSFALSVVLYFGVSESPLKLNLADYLVSYLISLIGSLVFMGKATYSLYVSSHGEKGVK